MLVRVAVAPVVAIHVFEILDPILDPTPTIVPWRVRLAEPEPNYPPSNLHRKMQGCIGFGTDTSTEKRRQRSIGNGQGPGKATFEGASVIRDKKLAIRSAPCCLRKFVSTIDTVSVKALGVSCQV